MSKKKLDDRIKTVIENGINGHHRSMFVIFGDKANYQVNIIVRFSCIRSLHV